MFPANDTSMASNTALVAESAPFGTLAILDALGLHREMHYFHLLLARLEVSAEIGGRSFEKLESDIRLDI